MAGMGTGRKLAVLLAVVATGLVMGSGAALSAPAAPPEAWDRDQVEPRVIGGDPVPDGKYRYVAAILNKTRGNGPFQQQFCGGTLIDRDSVLTAAHCFGKRSNPNNFRVLLGRAELEGRGGVLRDVKRIFRHPDYRPAITLHDAAVLKLSRPVGITRIKRAPVASKNRFERPGTAATVVGWGNTVRQSIGFPSCGSPSEQVNYPNRMRKARVPIASDSYASYVYNEYLPSFGYTCDFYEPFDMVAAGYEGKTTCQGDSGGPLIKEARRNGKRVHYQIGITSWGAGCGQDGYPSVYAEVNSRHIAPFIKNAASK